MGHGPAVKLGIDNASKRKARLGVRLFLIFSAFYAGFVFIGVFNYELLGKKVLGELNLAIVYGFGLIIFAIIMGVIYNYFCTRFEDDLNNKGKEVQS